jgi:hypothetical protein
MPGCDNAPVGGCPIRLTVAGEGARTIPRNRDRRTAELFYLEDQGGAAAPLAWPLASGVRRLGRRSLAAAGPTMSADDRMCRSTGAAPVAGLTHPRPEPSSGAPKRWPPDRARTGQAGARPIRRARLRRPSLPDDEPGRGPPAQPCNLRSGLGPQLTATVTSVAARPSAAHTARVRSIDQRSRNTMRSAAAVMTRATGCSVVGSGSCSRMRPDRRSVMETEQRVWRSRGPGSR